MILKVFPFSSLLQVVLCLCLVVRLSAVENWALFWASKLGNKERVCAAEEGSPVRNIPRNYVGSLPFE